MAQHRIGFRWLFSVALAALTGATIGAAASPGLEAAQPVARRVRDAMAAMTLDEKLDLVSSGVAGIARLGIAPLAFIDGPNGVSRARPHVVAFPNAIVLAATFDRTLARAYGTALGAEVHGTGRTLVGAPTVNIVRTPKWGRAPETLGEDPFLAGQIAAAEILGIQSQHVISQVKHYAANNQEVGRFGNPIGSPGVNVVVSQRALHEIYLPAFRAAVRKGHVGSIMCAYNRLNGEYPCQSPAILGLLRTQFGFDGFIEPDAGLAVRDDVAAATAGVDNFQLGTLATSLGIPMKGTLTAALQAGRLTPARLDEMVAHILTPMFRVGVIDHPPTGTADAEVDTPAHLALATNLAAAGTVLLRNRDAVLPLAPQVRSIAVIGFDAGPGTQIAENGSAAVLPGRPVITPLEGITARAQGVQVTYAPGTLGVVPLPVLPSDRLMPSSAAGPGLLGTFYSGTDFGGVPVTIRVDPSLDFETDPGPLAKIPGTTASSARWSGALLPPATGRYRFSITTSGVARLFLDGQLVVSADTEFWNGGVISPGANPISLHGVADLVGGVAVPIVVEYSTASSIGGAALHLGWQPPDEELRAAAVAAAQAADVAVVFVNDVSSEGMDRGSLALPGDQDALVDAVADANPRTIVVLHTAGPVLMPWLEKVAAVVEAWYPGQQTGAAIAAVLFGDLEPTGRLPITFPATELQGPATQPASYPGIGANVTYDEDLLVGYRYFDAMEEEPLFPFGHGLSFTEFALDGLRVRCLPGGRADATVEIANTGSRPGTAVVQLYLGFPMAAGEPPNQLKGFRRVPLQVGERRRVRLPIDAASFAIWDTDTAGWRVQPGTYAVRLGLSSRDLSLEATLTMRAVASGRSVCSPR